MLALWMDEVSTYFSITSTVATDKASFTMLSISESSTEQNLQAVGFLQKLITKSQWNLWQYQCRQSTANLLPLLLLLTAYSLLAEVTWVAGYRDGQWAAVGYHPTSNNIDWHQYYIMSHMHAQIFVHMKYKVTRVAKCSYRCLNISLFHMFENLINQLKTQVTEF